MKILLLNPNHINRYNWGNQLFKNKIGKYHDVFYYGEGYPNYNKKYSVKDIIKKEYRQTPDLILTYCWKYSQFFRGMEEIDNIPKIHIALDYTEQTNYEKQNKAFKKDKYDLIFGMSQKACNLLRKNNASSEIHFLPFSVDIDIYKPLNITKKDQILAAFTTRNDIYPNRIKVQRAARSLGYPVVTKRIIHENLIKVINASKIILTSNNIYRSFSMKYTETLACGGFLLADKADDMYILGYKNKVHYVLYSDINNLKTKIQYYMKNDTERHFIEKAGMKFVRKFHSCDRRVSEMTNIIKERLGL